MYSITELSQEQRDALIFWMKGFVKGQSPIFICDPHNYLSKMEASMDITKETRRESYQAVLPSVTVRQKAVLKILQEWGDMTAQEIAYVLHWSGLTPDDDRNHAAPRLTELKQAGKVRTVGKKICSRTGRTVTVWSAGKE